MKGKNCDMSATQVSSGNRFHIDCWRGRWRTGEHQALPIWPPLWSIGCKLLEGQHLALNFVVLALCFAHGMCTTHTVWDIKPSMTCLHFHILILHTVLLYLVGVLWGVKKTNQQTKKQHFAGLSALVYTNCKHTGGGLVTCVLAGPSVVLPLQQPLSWLHDWATESKCSPASAPSHWVTLKSHLNSLGLNDVCGPSSLDKLEIYKEIYGSSHDSHWQNWNEKPVVLKPCFTYFPLHDRGLLSP